MVNWKDPAFTGVPETTPLAEPIANPFRRLPALSDQLYGAVPPATFKPTE